MHGDERDAHHQKGEGQSQVAVVVEPGNEHGDQHESEHHSKAGRQNVNAAPIDLDRQRIAAVAARGPGA